MKEKYFLITKLIEYFEESDKFFLVFEKVTGGQLLDRIASRYVYLFKKIHDLA